MARSNFLRLLEISSVPPPKVTTTALPAKTSPVEVVETSKPTTVVTELTTTVAEGSKTI